MEMHPDGSGPLLALGAALDNLAKDQAEWSQATFGSDKERGPVGALKHLEKEAKEAQGECHLINHYSQALWVELADCFLLVLDAARRAGIPPSNLIEIAQRKMIENRNRKWPTPTPDEPVEHVRDKRDAEIKTGFMVKPERDAEER